MKGFLIGYKNQLIFTKLFIHFLNLPKISEHFRRYPNTSEDILDEVVIRDDFDFKPI